MLGWGRIGVLERASSDGVLATKIERKMLASTCLYSLYAWFDNVADEAYLKD